jgi:intraflagellar transport protein 81
VNRRLAETRATSREGLSGDAVLAAARREAAETRALVRKTLPAAIDARRETLVRLQRELAEPTRSEADLAALRGAVNAAESAVGALTASVAAAQRAAGDDRLAMFRQQAALVARKLAAREEAAEAAARDAEAARRELEAKEAKLSELSGPT